MFPSKLKPFVPTRIEHLYAKYLQKEAYINHALQRYPKPRSYLEIGVRDGSCIRRINAERKMAIDPAPVHPKNFKDERTTIIELPSDKFFETMPVDIISDLQFDVALIDGLHEFDQALRDFLHLERHMRSSGIVFLHDCNPPERENEENRSGMWNGDVWKVMHYLSKARPDLHYFTLDCDWGLGVVSNLNPRNPPPMDDSLIDSIAELDYSFLEQNRSEVLNLKHRSHFAAFYLKRILSRQ